MLKFPMLMQKSPKEVKHEALPLIQNEVVKNRLISLGQHRRFWRPVIKFLMGGNSRGTILTAVVFYFVLSTAITMVNCQKTSLVNILVPLFLLMAMELATDTSDMFLTEVAMREPQDPVDVMLKIFVSTMMATMEISLWFGVLQFYGDNKI